MGGSPMLMPFILDMSCGWAQAPPAHRAAIRNARAARMIILPPNPVTLVGAEWRRRLGGEGEAGAGLVGLGLGGLARRRDVGQGAAEGPRGAALSGAVGRF